MDIFETLLNIDKSKIAPALQSISSDDNPNMHDMKEIQIWAINQSYYGSHVKNRWPLFGNTKYITTPSNTRFDLNYNELYSNLIHKDYESLSKSSKKLKMIFIVGVEGVGHHFFRSLFDALKDIDSKHYHHQNDRPWPQDPLWLILDECWAFNLWGTYKEPSWLTVVRTDLPNDEQIMGKLSLCNIVQKYFDQYSLSLDDKSVLFLSTLFISV